MKIQVIFRGNVRAKSVMEFPDILQAKKHLRTYAKSALAEGLPCPITIYEINDYGVKKKYPRWTLGGNTIRWYLHKKCKPYKTKEQSEKS